MIRSFLKNVRQQFVAKSDLDTKSLFQSEVLQSEPLEDRIMLAFLGFFDGVTLTLDQTADDGDIVIDNGATGGLFRTVDNSGTFTYVDAENVIINLLDDTSNQIDFLNLSGHTGNVEINAGHGTRDINFAGNIIGGSVDITAGMGQQVVNIGFGALEAFGDVNVSLGDDFDTVTNNDNIIYVHQDMNLLGVNFFEYYNEENDAYLQVDGDFTMDTTNESIESFLLENNTESIIFGDFNYIGGDDIDHVDLNATWVVGDANIDLGEGIPFFGDPQNFTMFGEVDGNLNLWAGDSNLGNEFNLSGTFLGNTVIMNLSDTIDTVSYSLDGPQADVMAFMGGGGDTFTLNGDVNVLDIDFGNDIGDVFENNHGQFTFDSDIVNFHWFDYLYTDGDDTLVMNQLIDTGAIIIDNSGGLTGIDWQMTIEIGGNTSTTPARNLELNMLSNTGNNVFMDLVNPVIASITMELGDGDRNVSFVGDANNPLRDIRITAGEGDQNVNLSVNNPLGVATLDVNLGNGFDTVDDNANNLIVSENFFLTGVNHFENDGLLSVTSKARIDVSGESVDSIFANNGTFFVGVDFAYLGGGGSDEVRLNGAGGTTITEDVFIDLGGNNGANTQMALMNGPDTSFGGPLTVLSSGSSGTDLVDLDAAAMLGGDVSMALGDGFNDANIVGVLDAFFVDYLGGSGVDTVAFGTTGTPADVGVSLGAGNDTFTLLAGASISNLVADGLNVDFGPGDDTFVNLYGPFDFSAVLLDIDGFDHMYDHSTGTLTSNQVSDPGPVTVDDLGTGGSIRFLDGGITELTTVNHLTVNMQSFSGTSLDIQLDSSLVGDLNVDLADGNRDLNLTGADNSIGGNLSISGGDGDQNVMVSQNNALSVGGNLWIGLGSGFDTVDESGNDINVTGDFDFSAVNFFENDGVMTVGGNVTVDNSSETDDATFDDDNTMNIGGNLTYDGGSGSDEVTLNATTSVTGFAEINLGDNLSGGSQFAWFNGGSESIGGTLDVTSTDSSNLDSVRINSSTTLGDDVTINLGGGTNIAEILGVFGGEDIKYTGGSGADDVTFGTTGSQADVNVILGSGDDTFTLEAGASIAPTTLRVDFGGGNDSFENNFGAFTFNANLLNWHGFNRFYNHNASRLVMTQLTNTSDITVANNGVGNAIQLINGAVTEMTPADDVRVNMLFQSTTNVTVDYDSPQAGYTILDLRAGNRNVTFSGDSNTIGTFLRIEAGIDGLQNVVLAQNADLNVGESVVINLRDDHDVVDDGANNINVGTNFILRSVNAFENSNTMTVGGNLTVNNSFFEETSSLSNAGTLNVGSTLNYFGSDRSDDVLMSGANIAGNVNVELGGGNGSQTADFSGASVARLRIIGDNSAFGNNVLTDAATTVAGDVIVNFTGTVTPNNVTLQGNYSGTYGTYRGGVGVDTVVFGAVAPSMRFINRLGDSSDTFTLQASTDLSSSILDFGIGNDTFIDEIGEPYPFPLTILNL